MSRKVTVVIPSFNCDDFVASALESALQQSFAASEILVVDDGSTDNTEAVVRGFEKSGVRYIRQANLGVCEARNRGVAESTGELIAFLDADDIWERSKLEKQVAKFEDPEIGLVHCGMREFDSDSGETVAVHLDGGEGWVAEDLALWEKPVIIGPGGSIVVRREVFETVGGFDPDLKNGEDWEFCFRVAMQFKVGFVPEALVDYRNHGANATKNIFEMERSTLKAWAKVFGVKDERIRRLRRRSYGNLHKVLAGSFLHVGEKRGFARNLVKSLWYRPSYASFYLRSLIGRKDRSHS